MSGAVAAKRYAQALFSLAGEEGQRASVETDLQALAALLDQSAELASFVADPVVPEERQQAIVAELFARQVQPLTLRFLRLLVVKGRLDQLPAICRYYQEQSDADRGLVHARLVTARDLTGDQQERIRRRLEAKTGKQVDCQVQVDPALLGGFTIQLGDEVTDLSLRGQLASLRERLINA